MQWRCKGHSVGVKLGGGRRIRWRTVVGSGVLLSLVGASDLILPTVSDEPCPWSGADLAGTDVS